MIVSLAGELVVAIAYFTIYLQLFFYHQFISSFDSTLIQWDSNREETTAKRLAQSRVENLLSVYIVWYD